MANKRMFTMKICDSDAFLDMPLTAQALYFHLNMRADDDGFIGNPNRIAKLIGASKEDLEILIEKRFVLFFDDGVIVIKHWRMHNSLSKNRYHETVYLEEKSMLLLKDNGAYSLNSGDSFDDTKLVEQNDRQVRRDIDATKTNDRRDKDEQKTQQRRTIDATKTNDRRTIDEQKTHSDLDLDKDIEKEKSLSKERDKKKNAKAHFSPPTLEEIKAYCRERKSEVDPETFFDYYEALAWEGIKDWKAKFRVWEKRETPKVDIKVETASAPITKGTSLFKQFAQRDYDFDELEAAIVNK